MKFIIIFFLFVSTLSAGIGEVTATKGAVSLTRKGFSRSVRVGLELLRKDLITTKERSKAQVILNDDTVITIGPKSSYHFLEYTEAKDPKVFMQIDHGFFKAVTGKIGKIAPHRFKIKTRAATIGVRGTQFMAHVDIDEEQIACTKGKIIVSTFDKIFVVPTGKMLIFKNGQWHMRNIDFHLFSPITLEEDDLSAFFGERDLTGIDGSEIAQEQLVKQRSAPSQDQDNPDLPSEVFETSLDVDTQEDVTHFMEDTISTPIITTPNIYEISSGADDATPPPSFHTFDEVSVPAMLPAPDVYEINSAFDNTAPPPPYTP